MLRNVRILCLRYYEKLPLSPKALKCKSGLVFVNVFGHRVPMYISNSFKVDGFEVSDLKFSVSNLSTCYLDFGGLLGQGRRYFQASQSGEISCGFRTGTLRKIPETTPLSSSSFAKSVLPTFWPLNQ